MRKYGQVIGQATRAIAAGEHVHVHNLDVGLLLLAHADGRDYRATLPAASAAQFNGYVRHDGRVGTRNYVLVLSSVNCSATVCKAIERHYGGPLLAARPGSMALSPSPTAPAAAGTGEGIEILRRTLRGYAVHPNVGGVLVIGPRLRGQPGARAGARPAARRPSACACSASGCGRHARGHPARHPPGGRAAACRTAGCAHAGGCAPSVSGPAVRGGSDGYSGISANPALGAAVDLLVQQGGTAMLSETPEIYGAEHLLTARAASPRRRAPARAHPLVGGLHRPARRRHEQQPSPGNKAGGITTILEKSLGAVAKGGQTGLMEVLAYAQQPSQHGLVFMDTPGYDPVSATGQVAGGANLICFTTGRGSTYGCKPTPSLKIATTAIFQRMSLDMDFNARGIVDGDCSVAEAGQSSSN